MDQNMQGQMVAEDQGDQGNQDGYCIELRVLPNGTIAVSSEPIQAEEGETEQMDGKIAKSIQEALKMALEIYSNDGDTGGEEDFNAGFGGQPMREGE